jgi:predicted nucleic acid-binding protein
VIVLDTTVLLYAVGTEHRFRDPCRRVVERVAQGHLAATTTAEVIQEFAHVRARRRSREDAARLATDYLDLLQPLLSPSEEDVRGGLALWRRSGRLGSFDAVLAEAARTARADALISADAAFGDVSGLRHVVPTQEAVDALLAAHGS